MSIEEKAKAEARRLIAEVSQLQAKTYLQTRENQAETRRLMAEINKLQAAAIKERNSDKARQAQTETKRLISEQLTHLTNRQQSTREQLDRLLQAKQKYDFAVKNATLPPANSKDAQLHQQLLLMIKKKKDEYIQCNKEIEELKLQAQKQSISLDYILKNQAANAQTTSVLKPKENASVSVAERAKAEAEKLIKEVTKTNRVSDTASKAQEVSKMMEEINRLQMSAEQGTLTESEAKQLEERVRRIEEKQKEAREQINQLTQAKIKYELALAKSVEERSKESARREQDEKLRNELNRLIKAKEEEQRKLLEELELIRLRAEQEAALLKTQRDAARALAEQQAAADRLNKEKLKRGLSKNKMIFAIVLLVLTLGGGGAAFLMGPKINEWINNNRQKNDTLEVASSTDDKVEKPDKVTKKPDKTDTSTSPPTPKPAAVKAVRTFRDKLNSGGRAPDMVQLPAGTFWMGVPNTQPFGEERPQFEVTLESFSIGKYEVTVEEYRAFANATGRKMPEGNEQSNYPVVNVSWEDATAYADWLSRETGAHYRLPSEREWEYAARAGTLTTYPWGDELGTNRANCSGCGSPWDGQQVAPVGSFAPNAFGLHDMIGNVLEWTRTCYRPNYEGAPATGQDWEGGNCAQRVVRSSGFNTYPKETRVTKRKFMSPKSFGNNLGFRVARVNN